MVHLTKDAAKTVGGEIAKLVYPTRRELVREAEGIVARLGRDVLQVGFQARGKAIKLADARSGSRLVRLVRGMPRSTRPRSARPPSGRSKAALRGLAAPGQMPSAGSGRKSGGAVLSPGATVGPAMNAASPRARARHDPNRALRATGRLPGPWVRVKTQPNRGLKLFHSLHFRSDARRIAALRHIDPQTFRSLVPDYVFGNAVAPRSAARPVPLSRAGFGQSPRFYHATTLENADGIRRVGVKLGPGWGDIDAGFFLAIEPQLVNHFEGKVAQSPSGTGVLLEVALDPHARTINLNSNLFREVRGWVESAEGRKALARTFPFLKANSRISNDTLGRLLGAQVIVNQALYGQRMVPEIVVLDPSVVRKIRTIRVSGADGAFFAR